MRTAAQVVKTRPAPPLPARSHEGGTLASQANSIPESSMPLKHEKLEIPKVLPFSVAAGRT